MDRDARRARQRWSAQLAALVTCGSCSGTFSLHQIVSLAVIARAGIWLLCLSLALAGCASSRAAKAPGRLRATASCTPPAGGRCEGPEPRQSVAASPDDRTLATIVMCGGWLRISETPREVRATFVASAVGAGAMSCARVRLTARLATPLARRLILDATSGDRVAVTHCPPRPTRVPGYVLTACA